VSKDGETITPTTKEFDADETYEDSYIIEWALIFILDLFVPTPFIVPLFAETTPLTTMEDLFFNSS